MNHYFRLLFGMLLVAFCSSAFSGVEIYPFPASVPVSNKYSVTIYDDSDCSVHTPKALYSVPNLDPGIDGNGVNTQVQDRSMTYVPFAFTGEVEIEVIKLFGTAASRVEVSPKSYGIEPTYFDGTKVRFRLNHNHLPAYVSVNFVSADNQDSASYSSVHIKHGLMIFGEQPETGAPDLTNAVTYTTATRSQIENADLIYFPPGDHALIDKFGEVNGAGTDARIYLSKNSQHIYMAPGAFIRGSIRSGGHDFLKVSGRGVITGEDFYWHYFQEPGTPKGKTAFLNFMGSNDSEFKDFILINPTHHTMPSGLNSDIKNVKIIGWASNHDGVRPSAGSVVEQVFIKTHDDLDYARDLHTLKDSVIWPMRNGAFGMLGWNNLGVGNTTYQNIRFINSEWDAPATDKQNQGIIGSKLSAGVFLSNNLVENIQGEWGMGMLAILQIRKKGGGWQAPQNGTWGEISDFTFKNIIMEGEFENSGGVLVKNDISGFELDGAKAMIRDIDFINVIAGNQLVTNANAGNYFDIDPNTTANINFTTQGNIYDITTSSNAGGSLRPAGVVPTPAGMDRFISIIPNAGKKIVDVKIDGVSQGRLQNVFFANMSANHTVDVTFGNGTDHFGGTYSCSGGDTTPPAVPTGLVATAGDNQVSLDWNDNTEPDIAYYKVRRNTTGVAPWGGAIATPASSNYVDTTAVNGTTYYYAIRAVDTSENNSNNGNIASATPQPGNDTTPPAVPTGLVATAGDNQVSLNWDDNTEPDLSHYVVRRNTTGVAPWGGAIATPTSSNYVDTTAVNGTTYYYAIRAEDTSGNKSNNGNVASATPSAGGVSIPAKIEAEDYDAFNDTTSGNNGDPSCSGTDVDAETTSDTGGGCNVGWTAGGEWLEYDISSSGGTFDLVLRLAANSGGKTVTVKLDGNVVGTVTAPSLGWQTWRDRTISNVSIPAGGHTLRVEFNNGGVNFNYIDVQ